MVNCDVKTGRGQNLEDSSGHSDTEPTASTLCAIDRHWTD